MCGRYIFTTPGSLGDRFGVVNLDTLDPIAPSYNVAPGSFMPVIVGRETRRVALMKWGLIPGWAKDPRIGYKMINARDDTILKKPSFRKPFKTQRCLVPANGFYEWQKTEHGKTPFYIHTNSQDMMAFAGLYETWKDAEGKELNSFTIITTEPNALLRPIHNRMPVILEKKDEANWADEKTTEQDLIKMLKPYPADDMEAIVVSDLVNSPKNNSSELINPL